MTAPEKVIAIGTLAVASISAIGTWVNSTRITAIQERQTEIQKGQLDLAKTVAASQETIAQNRQATDLFPYILSKERRQRALGLQMLRRVVPTAIYSEMVMALTDDPVLGIRIEAIRQLGRVRDSGTLGPLTAIANDTARSRAEREAAKESSASVQANYDAIKACDLNGDGRVNVVDVQIAIDAVNKSAPCSPNRKGACTVIDVEHVMQAALGLACIMNP